MAKGKKHRKAKVTAAGAVGTGAVAGAATYLAGAVIKSITKEAVERGADRLLKRTAGSKAQLAQAARGEDVGLLLLRTLAESEAPVPLARLAAATEMGLLPCLEAVQMLRRFRLVKLGDGRRTAQLSPVGREALELLSPVAPEDTGPPAGDDSQGGASGDDLPPPPPADDGAAADG